MAQEVTAGRGEDEESNFGSMIGMVPGKKFVANTKITRRCVRACSSMGYAGVFFRLYVWEKVWKPGRAGGG